MHNRAGKWPRLGEVLLPNPQHQINCLLPWFTLTSVYLKYNEIKHILHQRCSRELFQHPGNLQMESNYSEFVPRKVKCLKAINTFDPQEWFSIMMNSCGIYDSQKKD